MPERGPFSDAIEKLEFERLKRHIAARAASPVGAEHVLSLSPSIVFAEIRDELDRVGELLGLLEGDESVPVEGMDDIRPILHRAAIPGSMVPAEDLRSILTALTAMRTLGEFIRRRSSRLMLIAHLGEQLVEDKLLEYHIDRVVDEEGLVRDGASKELRAIRREIIEKSGRLRRRMESILKTVSEDELVMEELVTVRDGRMVLPVKVEYKRQIPGFIHSASASGQTVYIEPMETLELNNEIRDLQFAEQREVIAILTELTDRLRGSVQAMLQSLRAYAEIDSCYARAQYGRSVMGSVPAVTLNGALRLDHARHPLLLLHKDRKAVVPLDIAVGDPEGTIVITGPNAGGKSVAMKTVGLLALMVQCGIPVPCDERSSFPVYRSLFVDIGDEQSLENDLSTFSSHVRRLAGIVEHAGEHSLVLIDEIGTGTDPSEGSALGAAILEALTSRGAHVIATTHHGMLKAFAHEHEGMQNAAMEFDLHTLEPTYRFRAGLPGSSYAFEITRRHGMDPAVIDRAKEIIGTQSDALEQLLAEVERQAQDLGVHLRKSEQLEEKYLRLANEYEARMKAAKKEAEQVRKQALEEAAGILNEANAVVENTIREIRETQASREASRAARERLREVRQRIDSEQREADTGEPSITPGRPSVSLQAGDRVAMRDNPSTTGVVIGPATGNRVEVAFGSMRMKVDIETLALLERPAEHSTVSTVLGPELQSNEIDVRGLYGDEAVQTVDRFLYDAWSAGLLRVDIIHGKGTGALRKRIHDYLRDVPFVESYALGEMYEGGSGMTKVMFKDE